MSGGAAPRRQIAARLLIGLAFVSLIAGAAVPAARQSDHAGQARDIVDLAARLERAARRHHRDTGLLAVEIAAGSAEDPAVAPAYHRLGMRQRYGGWKGPYLAHPLTLADSPVQGPVALLSRDADLRARGFSLASSDGFGQYLVLEGVSRHAAHLVERELDPRVEDDPRGWRSGGRVQWQEQDGTLLVALEIPRD